MIDFTFPPEVDEIRLKVRSFMDDVVGPAWAADRPGRPQSGRGHDRLAAPAGQARTGASGCRTCPRSGAAWASARRPWPRCRPRRPRCRIGPFVLNAQAPDEGNQHTLLHWGTPEQKEKYLRPLCEGTARSCFAMTEPEVAGSDPTLIQTFAYRDGDEWVDQRPQVVHLGRAGGQVRHPHRPHRGRPRDPAGRQHRVPRRPAERGLEHRARRRDDERRPQPLRDPHRGPAGARTRTCSAARARATCSASTASVRPGWPTACGGSARPRRRST